jgi:anti-anti-sigma factor
MADFWEPTAEPPLCTVQRIGDELCLFGEIDESNADELAACVVAEIRAGIIGLDLSLVRFFGVAGIRVLFAARTAATSRDGGLRVVCSPEVMRTLQLCRLTVLRGLHLTAPAKTRDGDGTARR